MSHSKIQYYCLASFNTHTPHITCLAVHCNLLYVPSINLINVFSLSNSNYDCVDVFNHNPTSGFVKSIAFHGSKIFTAHQDCKIRVWLLTPSKRHRLLSTLPTVNDRLRRFMFPRNYVPVRRHKKSLWIQHNDTVSGLSVNETESLVYSVSWDKSLKIWNASDHRCLESFTDAHEDAINAVVLSGNGTIIYTASADGCIKVWKRNDNSRRHNLVGKLEKHKSTVNALALNNDGKVLFSGGSDRFISVWEWETGTPTKEIHRMVFMEGLRGHNGAILCLVNEGSMLASGSADRTVRIWTRGNSSGYRCVVVLDDHEKPVKSLVAVPASSGRGGGQNGAVVLCSGSIDGNIKVWEVLGEESDEPKNLKCEDSKLTN